MVGADTGQYAEGDGNWCVDSGATTHITHDLQNLAISSDYSGNEGLMVGNGNLLSISSVGSNTIPLKSNSASSPGSLLLNNILFVPHITKNLLSISQFTKDNHVTIEFNSDSCFVKDNHSHKILLKGSLSNGVYQMDLSSILCKNRAYSAVSSANLPSTIYVPCIPSSCTTAHAAHIYSSLNSVD